MLLLSFGPVEIIMKSREIFQNLDAQVLSSSKSSLSVRDKKDCDLPVTSINTVDLDPFVNIELKRFTSSKITRFSI